MNQLGELVGVHRKSIADLKSIQELIDHANKTTENDLQEVLKARDAAMAARQLLNTDMTGIRAKLQPLCNQYSAARASLFEGRDGKPAIANSCLKSQGTLYTMLSLGQKAQGCVDTCKQDENDLTVGTCDFSGCHGKLRSTVELEQMLGSKKWSNQDAMVQGVCGTQDYKLKIPLPAGLDYQDSSNAEDTQDESGAKLDTKTASGGALLGVTFLQTEQIQGVCKPLRLRAQASRIGKCADFL
eukprot:TRINITY_DN40514_c0_g1_i1.p1 TRINITY_DN40514_c0_g1~~TRINITY_DN40514_c0_g1_i1.p1  ORF type:complete len:242 (+),score=36.57 TRINITY_DN40514_c0_g1_i1:74-799(+)